VTAERFPRLASFKTAAAFRRHLSDAQIPLRFEDVVEASPSSPLAAPLTLDGLRVGNRFCILPMEGWDGNTDGTPSDLTTRRWTHFGASGAKLIWGGEAVAVCYEGRANPNQLVIVDKTTKALAALRTALVSEHAARFGAGAVDDLAVGLQLTHSGRFARPTVHDRPEPLAAYAHPRLDARFPAGIRVLSDAELDALVRDFIRAAGRAFDAGFRFVDIKHCHGYLLHELLSARTREGHYGGSLENRTRFLRDVLDGIRAEVPGLGIVVRLSVFDTVPFRKGPLNRGVPDVDAAGYENAFGLLREDVPDPMGEALTETCAVLRMLRGRGVRWICTTAGSPYYCPHVTRPAAFPPIDGYEPPEDPLRGVARQIDATARLKAEFPDLAFVGSGYTYLQEWLPNVAQFNVRNGLTDLVGLGRMVLSYPELPADVLRGAPLRRKSVCRTFSDCTTGPRMGLVSGCYPLDPFYVAHPDAVRLREVKAGART
jgi:2,4-dienoyl-CoA reductase-like NADH-dependent reductase (Old Yellow Enzyme family)